MNNEQLEIINTLKDYVPKLYNSIIEVIDKIDRNKLSDTFSIMSNIIEGLQWTVDAIRVSLDSNELYDDICSLETLFSNILNSYETGDCVLAKDLLKYEMLPLVEKIFIFIDSH